MPHLWFQKLQYHCNRKGETIQITVCMHSWQYKCRASTEWQPSTCFTRQAPRLPPPHRPPNVLCNMKGEIIQITFVPNQGLNPVCRIQSPALYQVAIIASFYRKAVEVYLIPSLLHHNRGSQFVGLYFAIQELLHQNSWQLIFNRLYSLRTKVCNKMLHEF